MLQNLRTHILNLGFECQWILDSFKKSKPDKVYLIKKGEDLPKRKEAEEKIRAFCKKREIELKTETSEEDFYSLVRTIKNIISKEKGFIYLGLSSGSRDDIGAFILSSMIFSDKEKKIYLYSFKDGSYLDLPSFEMKFPKEEIIEVVKYLKRNKEKNKKKDLRDHMFNNGFLEMNKKCKDKEHTKYVKLNRAVLEPAEKEWGLIEISGRRKGGKITLTEEGEKWANIF